MKKWLRFFGLSFFSHSIAREGRRRGYTNAFLGFVLALVFLWGGFVGGDMLPFGARYRRAPDFSATVYSLLAEGDGVDIQIEDGELSARVGDGEYTPGLIVDTLRNAADREKYSSRGYSVIVDTRPADRLAEIEAYCVSNDGKATVITYEEYLTLSEVARLNFDFKLRYTGGELILDESAVASYRSYILDKGGESRDSALAAASELADGKITEQEYARRIYELYFACYYPAISAYEASSAVPLLRNYYYHEYITKGITNYLFIFNDYMTGSFESEGGGVASFNGFYSELADGELIPDGTEMGEAEKIADGFIKSAFRANLFLGAYAYGINTVTLIPFIALMLIVAAILSYSVLRLGGGESNLSPGAMLKITGSFLWFSGAVSAVLTVILMFFVGQSLINALPPVIFFAVLLLRAIIFAVTESRQSPRGAEQSTTQTEV